MVPGCQNIIKSSLLRIVDSVSILKNGVVREGGFLRRYLGLKYKHTTTAGRILRFEICLNFKPVNCAGFVPAFRLLGNVTISKRCKHSGPISYMCLVSPSIVKGRGHSQLPKFQSNNMASDVVPIRNKEMKGVLNLSAHKIFRELLTKELLTVVQAFIQRRHEMRIVGGAVRDILLSRHLPKDIDLATTATPDEMVRVFEGNGIRYIETGLDHGTLTAHLNGHNFEITTLRIDTEHDGRRAVVEFTNDWRLDAERRDLTINAMSIDFDGNLYDYFGGVDDLKAKHVRFVGDPEKRIKEDYLRILRYFRFYGRISETANDHVESTLQVIKECSVGLRNVAVERVWTELSRILTAHFAPSLLKLMYELGIAENIGEESSIY